MNLFFKYILLKLQIAFFAIWVILLATLHRIKSFFILFLNLNWRNKLALFSIIGFLSIVGLSLSGIVSAQDYNTYSLDNTTAQNNLGYQSSISPNLINDEFAQFASLVNQIAQGTQATSTSSGSTGLLGFLANTEGYIYSNNPVSFSALATYYVQSRFEQNKTSVYAAGTTGTGYNTLSPVLPIWDISRNIAYIVVAILVVFIGFLLLFGAKLGQEEVTIMSSIPKIIIALLLITFSYAIAGLMIDIANLGTNVIISVLAPEFVQPTYYAAGEYPVACSVNSLVPGGSYTSGLQSTTGMKYCGFNEYTTQSQKGVIGGNAGDFNIFRLLAPIVNVQSWFPPAEQNGAGYAGLIDQPTNIGILDGLLLNNTFALAGAVTIAIGFILNVLALYWAVRIFIVVLTAFIKIVLVAAIGPLMLVNYVLSGGKAIGNYLNSLLSSALIFPAVFLLIFIAAIFAFGTECPSSANGVSGYTSCSGTSGGAGNEFGLTNNSGPWFISSNVGIVNFSNGPLIFVDSIDPQYIWNFVALGIITIIPGLAKDLDEFFKTEFQFRGANESSGEFGKKAMNLAGKIPLVGGIIGNVV